MRSIVWTSGAVPSELTCHDCLLFVTHIDSSRVPRRDAVETFWVLGLPPEIVFPTRAYLNQVSGKTFLDMNLPPWAHETVEDSHGNQRAKFTIQLFKAETVEAGYGFAEVRLMGGDLASSMHILGDGNLVVIIEETPNLPSRRASAAAAVGRQTDLTNSDFYFESDNSGSPTESRASSASFSPPDGDASGSSSSPCDSGDADSVNSDCSDGNLNHTPTNPDIHPLVLPTAASAVLVSPADPVQSHSSSVSDRGSSTTSSGSPALPSKTNEICLGKVQTLVPWALQSRPHVVLAVRLDPLTVPRPIVHLCLLGRSDCVLQSLEADRQKADGENFLNNVRCGLIARHVTIVGHSWRVQLSDLYIEHNFESQPVPNPKFIVSCNYLDPFRTVPLR